MKSRARQTTDIWPGFVDALATLLILIIFVLMVFVLGQFFLAHALSGRDAALEILSSIRENSTTVIIKHANPCGVAKNKSSLTSFKNAFACDPISAFGGVVACNFKINKKIAQEINKNFLEVLLAKAFDKNALRILKKRRT